MAKDELLWLRRWFGLHFIIDVSVAVPLFVVPRLVLGLVGFGGGSVVLARIVAAALMGIGVESLLGRGADREGYLGMLRLKIIWSGMVVLGLLTSVLGGETGWLNVGWLIAVFMFFNCVWIYWFFRLKD